MASLAVPNDERKAPSLTLLNSLTHPPHRRKVAPTSPFPHSRRGDPQDSSGAGGHGRRFPGGFRSCADARSRPFLVLWPSDPNPTFETPVKICITDAGPKLLAVGTAASNGYKSFDVRLIALVGDLDEVCSSLGCPNRSGERT